MVQQHWTSRTETEGIPVIPAWESDHAMPAHPNSRPKPKPKIAARTCAQCDSPLSRYNTLSTCGPCRVKEREYVKPPVTLCIYIIYRGAKRHTRCARASVEGQPYCSTHNARRSA